MTLDVTNIQLITTLIKKQGDKIYFRCPICQVNNGDNENLVYDTKHKYLVCEANQEHGEFLTKSLNKLSAQESYINKWIEKYNLQDVEFYLNNFDVDDAIKTNQSPFFRLYSKEGQEKVKNIILESNKIYKNDSKIRTQCLFGFDNLLKENVGDELLFGYDKKN